MAELALSILGVVPSIVQAVAACQTIHKGIKTARKCVEHLDTISIDWKIQQGRFLNECVLLLVESGEEEMIGRAMVKDPMHAGWTSASLGPAIEKCLGDSYGLCQKIIKRIEGILRKVKSMMACFDAVRKQKMKGESLRASFQRLFQSVRFSFDQDELEKQIDLLREKNSDLESLRGQMERFRRNSSRTNCFLQREPMPKYYYDVQRISTEAHGALISSFSCLDASHHEHTASIGLDVEYGEEVGLNIAITYVRKCKLGIQKDPPIKFLLQSKHLEQSSLDLAPESVQKPESNGMPSPSRGILSKLTLVGSSMPAKRPPEESGECRKKKRRVAFAGLPEQPPKVQVDNNCNTKRGQHPGPTLDLAAISSACEFLRQSCHRSGEAKAYAAQIASLRRSDMARYIFYVSSTSHLSTHFAGEMTAMSSISLPDFLRNQFQDTVSVVQQYKLALKLARAVLQFHSTPWFEEEWSIRQLLVMPGPYGWQEELPVYINSKLSSVKAATLEQSADADGAMNNMQAVNGAKAPLSTAHRRGVYNITLFCLGIALLEIAYWKPLDKLREDEYDEDNIDTARRIANGSSVLGKWYDEAIRRCLRCDFGFGSDLKKAELQRAVYSDVICPLDELIERLNGLYL